MKNFTRIWTARYVLHITFFYVKPTDELLYNHFHLRLTKYPFVMETRLPLLLLISNMNGDCL